MDTNDIRLPPGQFTGFDREIIAASGHPYTFDLSSLGYIWRRATSFGVESYEMRVYAPSTTGLRDQLKEALQRVEESLKDDPT